MRTIVLAALLTLVLLSTAAFADESATQAERTEAFRSVSIKKSGISFIHDPASQGSKAEVPGLMNYQGSLTDAGGVALDTTVSMTFSIYPLSVGGTAVWTETQPAVVVSSGIFNVLLGSVNSIPDTVFKDPERWLGVQVGSDPVLEPLQRIAAVGYAFRAAEADTADFARTLAASDGDWTITGSDMHSEVPGNVGVGSANPLSKLTVRNLGANELQYALCLTNPDVTDSGGTATGILFETEPNDYGKGALVYERKRNFARGDFHFLQQANSGYDSPTLTDAVVTIKNDGYVGIGTTGPGYNLHVYSSLSTPTVIYGEKGVGTSTAAGVMGVSDTRNFGYLGGEMGASTEPFSDFNYGVYGRVEETGWGGFGGLFYNTSGNWGALAGGTLTGYDYAVYGGHSSGNYGYLGGLVSGVYGYGGDYGVQGYNSGSGDYGYLGGSIFGVYGGSSGSYGVWGYGDHCTGVYGQSYGSYGVYGLSNTGRYGYIASSDYGVYGFYDNNTYGYLGSSSYGGYVTRTGSSGNALYASMNHTGTTPGAGYGLRVYFECDTSGTSYLYSKSGIRTASPYILASDANYLFAVSGEQFAASPRRGGGVLGVFTDSQWGCLAYTSSGGGYYGAYFTSYGTGTGKSGIGFGSSAELLGGWVRGELYGLYASGDRYASYTDGNAFSNGYGATLHDVGGRERVATFTATSMEVDVYAHGVGTLNKGFCSVMFEEGFRNIVSDQVPVTVTVTPMGPCQQVYLASVDKGGFSVRESGDGKSSVQFAWIAIGRRRGFERRPEIPRELAEPGFDANMRGFAFNEGDLDGQSRSMWHDGSSLRWDTPPPSPVPVEKLRRAEQEKHEREREEQEVRRMEEENQKMLALQNEKRLERERVLETRAELKPMRRAPSGENTAGPARRQRENR